MEKEDDRVIDDLARRAMDGNASACALIYKPVSDWARARLASTIRCPVEYIDDAIQEAWREILSGRATYSGKGPFKAFLRTIARRKLAKLIECQGREPWRANDPQEQETTQIPPLERLIATEARRALVKVLTDRLSKSQKKLLYDKFFLGKTLESIARERKASDGKASTSSVYREFVDVINALLGELAEFEGAYPLMVQAIRDPPGGGSQ
jgi:RNA polymerase sigma factor (sigma-70 family)